MDKKIRKKNKHTESKKIARIDKPSNEERPFNGDSVLYNIPLYRYVYRGFFGNFGAIILLHSLFLQGLHLVHAEEILEKEEVTQEIEHIINEPSKVESVEKKVEVEDMKSNSETVKDNVSKADVSENKFSLSKHERDEVEDNVKNLTKIEKEELNAKSSTTLNYDESPNESSAVDEISEEVEKTFSLNSHSDSSSTTKTQEISIATTSHDTNKPPISTVDFSITTTSSSITAENPYITESVSGNGSVYVDSETNYHENVVDNININDAVVDVDEEQEKMLIETFKSSTEDEIVSSSSAPINHEFVSITKSDNEITFDKNECTELANGSFYCYQVNDEGLADSLFSSPDQDGDLEIFLVRDGKQAQLTNNNVDDASPYFDSTTNTIVWHRLISDRYQIISYDLNTQKETQLTNNDVNNMEPTKQGKYVVWQRWLNNGWNIVLFDGDKEIVITNTDDHNVAPHLQGNLVVWNRHNKDKTRTIEMYNIETGTYVTVNDPDGMTVDNPRMVLIYDSLQPNGEIVTKGYNIFTGEFIKLDTLPRQLPDIPDSESTTEVRALIQPKPEIKYNIEVNDNETDTDDADKTLVEGASTTTKETSTSTIRSIDDENFDLLIEKDFSSSTSDNTVVNNSTNYTHTATTSMDKIDIPDLEIPPFEPVTTASKNIDENVQ